MARFPHRLLLSVLALLPFLVGTSARAQSAGFSDVPANHWAADSIAKLTQAGILTGYATEPPKTSTAKPATAAKPAYNGDKPVTRYELAAILYRFVTYIERADRQKKSKMGVQATPPKSGKEAMTRLVAEGYVKGQSDFAKDGTKLVTATELALVLGDVITRSREKITPPSPDSLNAIPQPNHP